METMASMSAGPARGVVSPASLMLATATHVLHLVGMTTSRSSARIDAPLYAPMAPMVILLPTPASLAPTLLIRVSVCSLAPMRLMSIPQQAAPSAKTVQHLPTLARRSMSLLSERLCLRMGKVWSIMCTCQRDFHRRSRKLT